MCGLDDLGGEEQAVFSYEVTSIPLLRFHRYIFGVQDAYAL